MHVVLVHGDLGAVEDTGLVHVVPGVDVRRCYAGHLEHRVRGELLRPPLAHLGLQVVGPHRRAGPAPACVHTHTRTHTYIHTLETTLSRCIQHAALHTAYSIQHTPVSTLRSVAQVYYSFHTPFTLLVLLKAGS